MEHDATVAPPPGLPRGRRAGARGDNFPSAIQDYAMHVYANPGSGDMAERTELVG